MRKIDRLLEEYGESHQNATNKMVHWICVPLIFFSIVGLIWSIPHDFLSIMVEGPIAPYVNWALVILVLVTIYYFSLSFSLSIGLILFTALCFIVLRQLEMMELPIPLWGVMIGIFVLAWIGQFYGHKIEGKKPSFLKDIQFLLIGPAWLMHFIYKKLGIAY